MGKKRVAVVTGSTSGIGLGIAWQLARDGYDIVLNGLGDKGDIENLRSDIEKETKVAVTFEDADLANPKEIESMITRVLKVHGGVDILVNNAGIQFVSAVEDFPTEQWNRVIDINLSAAFHTTRLVTPSMKKNGFGRIVNIASAHGLVASPFKSAYVAAKHGIVGFTKSVALELAEFGVTCNAICPGWVETPLVQTQVDALATEKKMSKEAVIKNFMLERQPTRKFVQIEEIASLTSFLVSESARSITGSSYSIDGGWTAH